MPLTFQSLRSGSSGNCLRLSSGGTTILIDCGLKTQRECRALLDAYAGRIDGVFVTHSHGDHICYSALKTLQSYGTAVFCHDDVLPQVHDKHVRRINSPLRLTPFAGGPVDVGDFSVRPVALPHDPYCPTFGFVITWGDKKIVVATDFHDPAALAPHLPDSDFIFVEANHDLGLLRRYPNYASHFHLSNVKAAKLLCDAVRASRRPPRHVMLGHLSEQRNTERLAFGTVKKCFDKAGIAIDFGLTPAPRYTASDEIEIH